MLEETEFTCLKMNTNNLTKFSTKNVRKIEDKVLCKMYEKIAQDQRNSLFSLKVTIFDANYYSILFIIFGNTGHFFFKKADLLFLKIWLPKSILNFSTYRHEILPWICEFLYFCDKVIFADFSQEHSNCCQIFKGTS